MFRYISFFMAMGTALLMVTSASALLGPRKEPLSDNQKLNFTSPANPPFLNWPVQKDAHSYLVQLSQNKQFPAGKVISKNTTRNFWTPDHFLKEGRWYYRIKPSNGKWSDIYTLDISPNAIQFKVPARDGYWKEHPRLYFHTNDLPRMREEAKGSKRDLWEQIQTRADSLIGAPLTQEPPRFKILPDGTLDIDGWRRVVDAGEIMGINIMDLSFAYKITGEKKYLTEAIRQIDHVCSWKIPGSTADPYHVDHPTRDILHGLCVGYDWLYSDLSPEERAKIREIIVLRADRIYQHDNPFYGLGLNNHPWLRMAALADAGGVLLGEDPHAEEWLDFSEQIYAGRFWCLGGHDGEWHEGISYWSYALLFALEFADSVKSSTGVDFYKHPWMQKAPDFPLYAYPPFSSGVPFGDVHPWQQDVSTILTEMRLAKALKNPYAKWYADQPLDSHQLYVQRFLAEDDSIPSKAPYDLPQSILFHDVGWAVFHTSLTKSKDDVFYCLKSGHYFASGHEHPDQNSFALYAYGKRLVIDSGYYDWYGSPHHYGWVVWTKAHNLIMVDGKGQSGPFEDEQKDSDGKMTAFFRSPEVNYAIGDASNPKIYHGDVTKFIRKSVFLNPGILVMQDSVLLPKPSKLDWLLHTTAEPTFDTGNTGFDMKYQGVGLRFDFLSPEKMQMTKTIGYEKPPEKMNPQDCHMTFTIPEKTTKADFISVYQPYKETEGTPKKELKRIVGDGADGVTVGNQFILFKTDSSKSEVSAGSIQTDGEIATVETENGDMKGFSACLAKELRLNGDQILSASSPVSLSVVYSKGLKIHFNASKSAWVKIRLISTLKELPKGWKYDPSRKELTGKISAGESQISLAD